MPRKKIKSREEKSAENFFPTSEKNTRITEKQVKDTISKIDLLKKSTEKQVKENTESSNVKTVIEKKYSKPTPKELETVEYIGIKKATRKKTTRKKASRKTSKKTTIKEVKFTPPKILLKKDGYELIITEKPQAALKISSALGDSTKRELNKVAYYEVDRKGEKIIVACAVGHLFTLTQNSQGAVVPTFDISWLPNYLVRKKDFTKRYYDTILQLAKNAKSITIATDFDVEGEVIGMNVMRYICNQPDANRMKFSTLTTEELNKAYEKKSPRIEWGQAIAGETRHYLDWFYGINLSRALMNAIKTTGKFKIMSIGRVQGPALNLIVNKEKEIQKFKPEPYWQAFIKVKQDWIELELKYIKDIFDKSELTQFENLKGKKAQASTKKTEQIIPPNPPFNLTTLQTEAYKFHGITPSKTLQAAQSLYLAGLISYPRTSSQKLPKEIEYDKILKKLAKEYNVEKLTTKKTPIEGPKTDPAHPSIYPTGNRQILSGNDEKIYELIVRRFLSLFCEDAIIDNKKIIAEVNNLKFATRGSSIRKKSWLEIYPSKLKEINLPDLEGEVEILNSKTEEKETQPPKRFSPASILSELEKRNLGTKATRAAILETLYDRGYVKEKSIEATPLGISLIETLEKYSPIIIDEELTRNFENEMEQLQENSEDSKELIKKENQVIEKAKFTITEIANQFNKSENQIGKALVQANQNLIEQQKIENILMKCPKCGKGELAITYSKKTRKHFVACNAYPNCKTTYSLPPNGTIKKTDKLCEECGFPLMMALQAKRKPWFFCFNPECPSNKKRIEEYQKRKQEEASEKSSPEKENSN